MIRPTSHIPSPSLGIVHEDSVAITLAKPAERIEMHEVVCVVVSARDVLLEICWINHTTQILFGNLKLNERSSGRRIDRIQFDPAMRRD